LYLYENEIKQLRSALQEEHEKVQQLDKTCAELSTENKKLLFELQETKKALSKEKVSNEFLDIKVNLKAIEKGLERKTQNLEYEQKKHEKDKARQMKEIEKTTAHLLQRAKDLDEMGKLLNHEKEKLEEEKIVLHQQRMKAEETKQTKEKEEEERFGSHFQFKEYHDFTIQQLKEIRELLCTRSEMLEMRSSIDQQMFRLLQCLGKIDAVEAETSTSSTQTVPNFSCLDPPLDSDGTLISLESEPSSPSYSPIPMPVSSPSYSPITKPVASPQTQVSDDEFLYYEHLIHIFVFLKAWEMVNQAHISHLYFGFDIELISLQSKDNVGAGIAYHDHDDSVVILYSQICSIVRMCMMGKWSGTNIKKRYPRETETLVLPKYVRLEEVKDVEMLERSTCVENVPTGFQVMRIPLSAFEECMDLIASVKFKSNIECIVSCLKSKINKSKLPSYINLEKWQSSIGDGIFYEKRKRRKNE
jgi:hypothetical protein